MESYALDNAMEIDDYSAVGYQEVEVAGRDYFTATQNCEPMEVDETGVIPDVVAEAMVVDEDDIISEEANESMEVEEDLGDAIQDTGAARQLGPTMAVNLSFSHDLLNTRSQVSIQITTDRSSPIQLRRRTWEFENYALVENKILYTINMEYVVQCNKL